MPAPYRASTVANELYRLATEAGRTLTPMQYVKLTYIAHGWSLALLDRPLLSDKVEAWKYGPVVPELYRNLKHFGGGSVTQPVKRSFFEAAEDLEPIDRSLISEVFAKYGQLSGVQLSNLTHKQGTPWQQVFNPNGWGEAIPNDLIRAHYLELARERAA